ncbi:MAG: hypothetical protein ACLFMO_06060 [Eubacteriales bacterium]
MRKRRRDKDHRGHKEKYTDETRGYVPLKDIIDDINLANSQQNDNDTLKR